MKKFLINLFSGLLVYLLLIQPILSLIFIKGEHSETVLLKVTKAEKGNFDLGIISDYKFKYDVEVFERDGWVGYVDKIYSNKELIDGKIYGLELHVIECSSWFDYFVVPSLWSRYSYDISDIYNNNKNLKKYDFDKEDHKKLFEAMEDDYSIWDSRTGN
jgi:hypothetical protein